MKTTPSPRSNREQISLNEAVTHVLEECRTVVPGMQALFGFQLIAVFNSSFRDQLSHLEQVLHLIAIVLVVVAIGLVMAPAAVHRQMPPRAVSLRFIVIGSRLLHASMFPLAAGITLDLYLVSRLIVGAVAVAIAVAVLVLASLGALWWLLPRIARA